MIFWNFNIIFDIENVNFEVKWLDNKRYNKADSTHNKQVLFSSQVCRAAAATVEFFNLTSMYIDVHNLPYHTIYQPVFTGTGNLFYFLGSLVPKPLVSEGFAYHFEAMFKCTLS